VQYYASYPYSEVRAMDRIISAVILLAVTITQAMNFVAIFATAIISLVVHELPMQGSSRWIVYVIAPYLYGSSVRLN